MSEVRGQRSPTYRPRTADYWLLATAIT